MTCKPGRNPARVRMKRKQTWYAHMGREFDSYHEAAKDAANLVRGRKMSTTIVRYTIIEVASG